MKRWYVLVAAVLAVFRAAGQSSPSAAPAQEPPVIRSDSQEVVLDVVVRDKKGRLVRNIKAEEIHVAEDGRPVPVRNFSLVSRAHSNGAARPGDNAGTHDSSARFERHIALIFDDLGTTDTQIAKRAALQVVRSMTDPDIYLCLIETGIRSRMITPFSNDRVALTKAIESYTAQVRSRGLITRDSMDEDIQQSGLAFDGAIEASEQRAQQAIRMYGQMGAQAAQNEARVQTQINQVQTTQIRGDLYSQFRAEDFNRTLSARPTLSALQSVVNWERNLAGRKCVLLFTHGIFITDSLRDSFRQLISAANKAGVTFYVLDISGLNIQSRMDGDPADRLLLSNFGATADRMGQGFTFSGRTADLIRKESYEMLANGTSLTSDSFVALSELTGSTGGFLIANTNDFRKPTQRLLDDLSTYYELTYSRQNSLLDGRYHPLQVAVDRSKVRVQTRSGYFALPNESGQVVQPWEVPLLNALNSAAPHPTSVPSRVATLRFHAGKDRVSGVVVVEVPFSALQVEEDDKAKLYTAHFSWVALLRSADGSVAAKMSRNTTLRGSLDSLPAARRIPLDTDDSFSVPPGEYTLEVQVQDRISTHMGWASAPVAIQPYSSGPQLSDLIVARRIEAGNGLSEWLRTRQASVVPALNYSTSLNQKSANLFFILFPDASAGPASFHMQLARGGQIVDDKPLALPKPDSDGGIRVILSIPLTALEPGDYDIRALLSQASQSVSRTLRLQIAGSPQISAPKTVNDAESAPVSIHERTWNLELIAGPKPDPEEQRRFLDRVKQRVQDYEQALPNFVCTQVTDRFAAVTRTGEWKSVDRLRDRVEYLTGTETYSGVDDKGRPIKETSGTGLLSSGELGSLLHMVLHGAPEWNWQGASIFEGDRVQIYSFHVPLSRSMFQLSYEPKNMVRRAGFSGFLYAQADTGDVRLIELEAEDLPKDFPIRETQIEIRYDYVRLAGGDRLLPTKGVIRSRTGRRALTKNEISFLDYRVFDATSKMHYGKP